MMGVGDVTAGGKRKERSPLTKLDVKSRAMEAEEIDLILKRKPNEKESATLGNPVEQGGKRSNIGTVQIREPGMYGQLTSASVRENILVERNLIDE